MHEWQRRGPDNHSPLAQVFLEGFPEGDKLARVLAKTGALRIVELKTGLQIDTTSYVGHVRIGPVDLSIKPKIGWDSLFRLARYAYDLRSLPLTPPLPIGVAEQSLADLLVLALCSEARQLAAYGVQQGYSARRRTLMAPRGRLDVARNTMLQASGRPGVACVISPRSDDTVLNQVVLAGLRLAASSAMAPSVRAAANRAAAVWEVGIDATELTARRLRQAQASVSRLSERYLPALALVVALYEGTGVSLEGENRQVLPGFLFDMNRFFQRLLSRFLHEFLDGYSVRDEHVLRGMIRYSTAANPLRKAAPSPRPDFAIQAAGQTVSLLDAKYRDLWATRLPREMLYQLSVYALSQSIGFTAAILYPRSETGAKMQRIDIVDPLTGQPKASVELRPVPLQALEELLSSPLTPASRLACRQLAQRLVLGAGD